MYSIPRENLKEFEFCGILQAHEDGYLGQGITMMEWESCNPNHPMYHNKVIDPFNKGYNDFKNTHGGQVVDVKHMVAPHSTIFIGSCARYSKGNSEGGKFFDETVPFILEKKVHLVGASVGGSNTKGVRKAFQEMIDNGTIVSTSAGNAGDKGLGGFARTELAISVGAIGFKNNKIYYKNYSSRGKELDYTCFSGLYVHNAKKGKEKKTLKVEGTSFSYPMFEGMMAITQSMFKENIGRTLYQDEMIMFLDDHLMDLGKSGWDQYFGKGLYIIPKYNKVNYNKYLLRGRKSFTMPNQPVYKDLQEHWSKIYVEKVKKKYPKAFNGYTDGTFRPNEPVTRGELAKVLSEILEIK